MFEIDCSIKADLPTSPILRTETHDIQNLGFGIRPEVEPNDRIAATVTPTADYTINYISKFLDSLLPEISSLPRWSDDITEQFGTDLYDRMSVDSEVSAALDILAIASNSQDTRFIPAVDEGQPKYNMAKNIADFFTWMFNEYCEHAFDDIRYSIVKSALMYGSGVGEIRLGVIDSGKYRNYIGLKDIKHVNIKDYTYAVDNFNNLIGLVPTQNTNTGLIRHLLKDGEIKITSSDITRSTNDTLDMEPVRDYLSKIVPVSKFLIYTYHMKCNDPRGASAIRPAYTAWWVKQQTINEMLSWLEKFSQPSIIGEVSERAQDICIRNEAGVIISTTTAVQQLADQLEKFKSSSVLAVPSGTKVTALNASSGGDIFLKIIEWADQEISRAILKQHLATSEGLHQSRAASTVHQDILSLVVISIKNWQKRTTRRQLLRYLTILNFGERNSHLTPYIDIGDGDGFPLNPFEVSQLQGVGWFSPSQMPEIDRLLGLPVRSESTQELARIIQGGQPQPQTNGNGSNNGSGPEVGEPE